MRHGANIPDIRALLPLLTSIDTNVGDIEALLTGLFAKGPNVRYFAALPNATRIIIAKPAIEAATVYNAGTNEVELSERGMTVAQLSSGESIDLDLVEFGNLYARSLEGLGMLLINANVRQGGQYTYTLGAEQTILSDATPFLYGSYSIAIGGDTFVTRNAVLDIEDANFTASFTPSFATRDFAFPGGWILTEDGDDLIRVNIFDGTETTIATLPGLTARQSFAYNGGYYALSSATETEIVDAGGTSIVTVPNTGLSGGTQYDYSGQWVTLVGSTDGDYTIVDLDSGTTSSVSLGTGFTEIRPTDQAVYALDVDNPSFVKRVDYATGVVSDIRVEYASSAIGSPAINTTGSFALDAFGADGERVWFVPYGNRIIRNNQTPSDYTNAVEQNGLRLDGTDQFRDPWTGSLLDTQSYGSGLLDSIQVSIEGEALTLRKDLFSSPVAICYRLEESYDPTP